MSYLVLARKWRPQTFADVVGQEPVVRTLQNAITRERIPHALIFSGVRGVGKTTLARLMAKALNCETGPTPTPCNSCDSCTEIMAGSAIDLHEIDGASNRGIQEIRELKENIRFFPTKGRYKIIIIDEVHMLTTEAFNALLKTLEEPPAHVIFMFATTELHKIPITILSRCQRYELKRVPFATLATFFAKIAKKEGVSISEQALFLIVREAEGSVRDGLSLLDQIFSFGGDEISEEDISLVLGLVDSEVIGSLAVALLAGDIGQGLELLDRVYSLGIDLKRFTGDLLVYFRSLLVCNTTKQPENLLDLADQDLASIKEIAASHSFETLHQAFEFLLKGVGEMQYSTQPRLVLETTFMKMVQAGAVVPVTAILERLDGLMDGSRSVPSPPKINAPTPSLKESVQVAAVVKPKVTPVDIAPKVQPKQPEKSEKPDKPETNKVQGKAAQAVPAADTPVEPVAEPEAKTTAPQAPLFDGASSHSLSQPSGHAPSQPFEQKNPPLSQPKTAEPEQEFVEEKATATATTVTAEESPSLPTSPSSPQADGHGALQKEVRQNWDEFIDYVQDRKKWMGLILRLSSGVRENEGELLIKFDDPNDCKRLQDADNRKAFAEFFLDFFQKEPQRLTFKVQGQDATVVDGKEEKSPQQERRALANEVLVEMATDIFSGQVANIRTGPRSR